MGGQLATPMRYNRTGVTKWSSMHACMQTTGCIITLAH